jgi:type I restriction enzyme, R subunit
LSAPTSTFTTAPSPTEQLVEDVAALHFAAIGAAIQRGVEIDAAGERADSSQCILPGRLTAALQRLNPDLPRETIEGVARTLARPPHPTLIQNNRWFHAQLTDGVEVEYRDARSGETRGGRARLIDFADPDANDLLVVRQLAVTGPSGKVIRLDLNVFLNGLPIAVIELKDPTDPEADLGAAIDQLDRYQHTAPDLLSGKEVTLLPLPPLRTVLEGFPSYGSSLNKALCHKGRLRHFQLLAMNLPMAIGM